MLHLTIRASCVALALSAIAGGGVLAQDQPQDPQQAPAPGNDNPNLPPLMPKQPGPDPIPEVQLVGNLETHPVRRGSAELDRRGRRAAAEGSRGDLDPRIRLQAGAA